MIDGAARNVNQFPDLVGCYAINVIDLFPRKSPFVMYERPVTDKNKFPDPVMKLGKLLPQCDRQGPVSLQWSVRGEIGVAPPLVYHGQIS